MFALNFKAKFQSTPKRAKELAGPVPIRPQTLRKVPGSFRPNLFRVFVRRRRRARRPKTFGLKPSPMNEFREAKNSTKTSLIHGKDKEKL